MLVDQESEANLGGQAFWSFGGLFLVDSPEQRRMGIRDSRRRSPGRTGSARPASTAPRTRWPRPLGRARYVEFAAGEKRAWLHEPRRPVLPGRRLGRARAAACADGRGNSVPRFHIVWGTGPGIVEPFERRVREHVDAGRVRLAFRHRVDALTTTRRRRGRRPRGAAGARTPPGAARRRTATWSATSSSRAQAVVVTSGGIGGNHELVRADLAGAARQRRRGDMLDRRPGARRRPDARRSPRRPAASVVNARPDVALHRGRREPRPDLAGARHPDPARAVVAVARRERAAAARAAVPRLRHPRHARAHRAAPGTSTPGSSRPRRSSRRSSRCRARSRTPT